jgi:hypothetical protein
LYYGYTRTRDRFLVFNENPNIVFGNHLLLWIGVGSYVMNAPDLVRRFPVLQNPIDNPNLFLEILEGLAGDD